MGMLIRAAHLYGYNPLHIHDSSRPEPNSGGMKFSLHWAQEVWERSIAPAISASNVIAVKVLPDGQKFLVAAKVE
jgi:hypothetical protein